MLTKSTIIFFTTFIANFLTVLVYGQVPVCDFLSYKNIVETNEPLEFYDYSTNTPTDWQWYIHPNGIPITTITYLNSTGDTSQNPTIAFIHPGRYKVCLTSTNQFGNSTKCKDNYIIVKTAYDMCDSITIQTYRSAFGYIYDDGGKNNNYGKNKSCSFALYPCVSKIILTFSEFNVDSGDYLKIYDGFDNSGIPLWDTVNLPNGLGNNLNMSSQYFDTQYVANTGMMYFEWTTNSFSESSGFKAEWRSIQGSFPKPTVHFNAPDTACANIPVNFKCGQQGNNLEYCWDFDNNGIWDYCGNDAWYTYSLPGIYSFRVKVQSCGGDSTYTGYIAIKNPQRAPSAKFQANLQRPLTGIENVNFSDNSKPSLYNDLGCSNNWLWEFTPNTYTFINSDQYSQNPIVKFNDTGCYDVKFIVGYNGHKDTITDSCYIYAISYCNPSVTNLNPDIGISRVIIADIDNISLIGLNTYTNYTDSAYLDLGATYAIIVERQSNFNSMNRKVWIDFNIDGDFEDQGELVAYKSADYTKTWIDSISIPASATIGRTRMRIGTSLGSMSNSSCGTNAFGEFEDYQIILRQNYPSITLTIFGPDTVYLEECTPNYVDPGASAWSSTLGNITNLLIPSNNINLRRSGTYWYKWTLPGTGYYDRTIIVTPETIPPEISLIGRIIDTIDVFTYYYDSGYNAFDTCSGLSMVSFSGTVNTSIVGVYTNLYTAYDNYGNFRQAARIIYVMDQIDPQITLLGGDTIYISVHDTFFDPWVTVSDNYWSLDSLKNVIVTGYVNTSIIGEYTLTYTVTDSSGNGPVKVKRVVRVIDYESPVIKGVTYNNINLNDGDTIYLEVYDYFTNPDLNISDNYYSTFNIYITGSFYSNFPTGQAKRLGMYNVIYSIIDGSGNSNIIEFFIRIRDTQKPFISFVGDYVVNLCRFEVFDQDSAFATDNYDTNITVVKNGTYYKDYIPNRMEGLYIIEYNAADNSGNEADPVERLVFVNDCGLNQDELNQLGNIKIYPNPNNGQFILILNFPEEHEIKMKVLNSQGKVILSRKEKGFNNTHYEFDISEYPEGIYLLLIQYGEENVCFKINVVK